MDAVLAPFGNEPLDESRTVETHHKISEHIKRYRESANYSARLESNGEDSQQFRASDEPYSFVYSTIVHRAIPMT